MTKDEGAKAYQAKIVASNPQAEAYDFESAYREGWDDGFSQGIEYMKQRAFNWMLKNVRLIGSPMELKAKYESEV